MWNTCGSHVDLEQSHVIHMWFTYDSHIWFPCDSHVFQFTCDSDVFQFTCGSRVNHMWITCDCSNSTCEPHVKHMCIFHNGSISIGHGHFFKTDVNKYVWEGFQFKNIRRNGEIAEFIPCNSWNQLQSFNQDSAHCQVMTSYHSYANCILPIIICQCRGDHTETESSRLSSSPIITVTEINNCCSIIALLSWIIIYLF